MFEILCVEKEATVWRHIRLLSRTPGNIMGLVDRMQSVPNFLPKENPYAIFVDQANTFFEVDDVGLIAVMPIADQLHCHITFWDKRLRGRENLCRKLAMFVREVAKKELFTAIPADRTALLAFAKRAGFVLAFQENNVVFLRFTNYTG